MMEIAEVEMEGVVAGGKGSTLRSGEVVVVLVVDGLHPDLSELTVRELLQSFGVVRSLRMEAAAAVGELGSAALSGHQRAICEYYVDSTTAGVGQAWEDASRVLDKLNGRLFLGRRLTVREVVPRAPPTMFPAGAHRGARGHSSTVGRKRSFPELEGNTCSGESDALVRTGGMLPSIRRKVDAGWAIPW